MQTNVEQLGALERRINVSIPQEKIQTEVENRLKHLARTVKLHGFRPGKVPFKIVMQQYGPQIRKEVIGDALKKNFSDAVRENNLRVAGYPHFEPKAGDGDISPIEFSATFEVYPDVTLGDLSEVQVERPSVNVTRADIDKTIEVLRRQRVEFEPADKSAQSGDRISIDYRGLIDGVEFAGGKAENFTLILGEGAAAQGLRSASYRHERRRKQNI